MRNYDLWVVFYGRTQTPDSSGLQADYIELCVRFANILTIYSYQENLIMKVWRLILFYINFKMRVEEVSLVQILKLYGSFVYQRPCSTCMHAQTIIGVE